MPGRPVRTVLFDLDGTLVDTSYVHAVCWWQALIQYSHQISMAQIHRAVGLGADRILDHLLGEDHDPKHDDEIVAAHATLFTVWYDRARAFPQAAELLRWCADSGRNVVLATSASEKDLEALRQVVDADDAITASTTVADAERSKPDTDILQAALDRVGGTAAESVFVGDAVWDMMAARRLDMRCIGLECGGITEAELRQAGADEVWRDPADLLSNIEKSALASD